MCEEEAADAVQRGEDELAAEEPLDARAERRAHRLERDAQRVGELGAREAERRREELAEQGCLRRHAPLHAREHRREPLGRRVAGAAAARQVARRGEALEEGAVDDGAAARDHLVQRVREELRAPAQRLDADAEPRDRRGVVGLELRALRVHPAVERGVRALLVRRHPLHHLEAERLELRAEQVRRRAAVHLLRPPQRREQRLERVDRGVGGRVEHRLLRVAQHELALEQLAQLLPPLVEPRVLAQPRRRREQHLRRRARLAEPRRDRRARIGQAVGLGVHRVELAEQRLEGAEQLAVDRQPAPLDRAAQPTARRRRVRAVELGELPEAADDRVVVRRHRLLHLALERGVRSRRHGSCERRPRAAAASRRMRLVGISLFCLAVAAAAPALLRVPHPALSATSPPPAAACSSPATRA